MVKPTAEWAGSRAQRPGTRGGRCGGGRVVMALMGAARRRKAASILVLAGPPSRGPGPA